MFPREWHRLSYSPRKQQSLRQVYSPRKPQNLGVLILGVGKPNLTNEVASRAGKV